MHTHNARSLFANPASCGRSSAQEGPSPCPGEVAGSPSPEVTRDISGHVFIYSPEPNIAQEGPGSWGRVGIRAGEHLAVTRKHTYEEATYCTK